MRPLLLAAVIGIVTATPAFPQDGYLFGMPRATLTVHVGAAGPAANDELFRFFTDQLTLDRSDFTAPTIGFDIGMRVHPRFDVLLSVASAHSSDDSEFRDFVEVNDQPIEQTTKLSRTAVTAGLKAHLTSQGRSLGRYAFIPTRVSPYVGAGAGVMWYRLRQEGDFVDFETLDIFADYFESDGATFTANVFAGGNLWLKPRWGLNLETRYSWAKADLHDSFSDFEQVDLRGWQLTAGVSVRY
ncbi:MAG TPA: outer membrane beta-barrel protein [Longimicrobiales bacterium]